MSDIYQVKKFKIKCIACGCDECIHEELDDLSVILYCVDCGRREVIDMK